MSMVTGSLNPLSLSISLSLKKTHYSMLPACVVFKLSNIVKAGTAEVSPLPIVNLLKTRAVISLTIYSTLRISDWARKMAVPPGVSFWTRIMPTNRLIARQ
jgi:hypothetical protein